MGQLLREYRRVYPNDTRSDLSILELYRDQLGEEKFRQYSEDYDSYINEVNKLVPLGIGEEFSRGFTRGYEGLKGTAKGAAALALGKLIPGDQEETEDRLLASARENFQKASRPDLSSTGQGALQGYAAGAGEVVPSLLEAGVTGAAGALVGAAIVPAPDPADAVTVPAGFLTGLFSKSAIKNAIKENITLRLGKEATKEGVEKKYKDIVKEETTEALERAARSLNITDVAFAAEKRKVVSQALGVGVTGLNSIGLSSGEIYNQLRSDPDIDRDTAMNYALAGGVAAGVAEAAMPAMILSKAVRSVGSTKIRPYDVDGVYSKIVNSFPGKLAKNLGGSMAVEGGTEAYQSWVSIVTQKAAKGMTLGEAIDAPLSYEEEKEIAHAFKLGLIAGSLGGGVSLGIDALTGNEAIEYIDQIERTEEDQARAEIPLSSAKLTNEEMEQLDQLALRFAVSMEVRQETEEGESIIIGIQRAAVDSELYNEEIKPFLDPSPTRAKYFSNRMVDLRAKIKLAIKENEERREAARVEAEKQQADSGLPQMTVEQKFEALNNALAATQEERDIRADLEARAGGIEPVVRRGVADTELETDQAIRSSYERIEPEDSGEVKGKIAELAKLNEEFSFMIGLENLEGKQRKKLISDWKQKSGQLIKDIDKGRADQRKAEAKREADKKKAEAAEEKRKKKEEELTVKPKTVEENNNQLRLNVGNRSAQRADELALIGASIEERTAKAAQRVFEGINTDTKKVEEIPDEVISAAVEEAYEDGTKDGEGNVLIPKKDEDGNDLPLPEISKLPQQLIKDVLEANSSFTRVDLKKADYDSKADLLQKKKKQAAKIEEVLKQIDAGEVSGLPEDLIAFQTQPGDERRVEVDNLGNPKDPKDQSMSYPAYYEAEGNLTASDRFRIAVQAAYKAIEESGDSVADVKLLGELLKSETFDKAPKAAEGKTTMLTRMVVLKDTRDDAPKDAKYQIVTITKSSAKQNYRVGIPVGVIKEKKNTVNIGLDEAMRIGFEPVASIRMTVPVDGLTYTMSEQEFKSMSQRLNQRRVHEADRAVIDDTAATKSVENISKEAGAATEAQEKEEGGPAPDLIADVTAQEEKTFTEEGEEVSLDQQIANAKQEEDEAADALLAALDKMNLGVQRLDLVKQAVILSQKDGRETNLPVIDQDFPDFIDRYVRENKDLPAEEVFHKLFMDKLGPDFIGRDKVGDPGINDEASLVSAADLAQEAIDEYIIATKDAGLEINLQEAATLVFGLASNEINKSIQNVQKDNKDTEQADNKQGQATDDGAPQSTVDVARKGAEAQQLAQAEGEPNVTEVEDDGTVLHREISLETIDVSGEYAIEHLVNMSKEELEISKANFRNEVEDIVSGSLSSTLARGRKLTRWRKMLDASQDRSEALFDGEGLEGITYSDNLPTQAQKDEVLRRLMQELRADSEVKAMPDGMGENITDKTVFDALEAYEAFVDRSEGIGTLALMDRLGISQEEATGVFEAVLNFKDAGESRVGVAIGEQAAKLAEGYETAIDLEFARREADLLKDPASVQELFRSQDVGVHGTDSETALKILGESKGAVRIFEGSHYDIASKDTGQSLTYSVRFVFPADEIRKKSTEKQYRPGEFVSRSQVVAEPVAIIIDNGLDDTTEGLAEVKALAESKGIKVFEKESVFLRRGDAVGGRVKEVSLYYESVLRKQDNPEKARREERQLREEIGQQRDDFDAELAAWISGEGPMPSEPKYIYRGLYGDFTEGHGSPWLDVAAVAGKLGGSPGAQDIYRYYDSGNRLYYRGGALAGPESVLEPTRIDSTYGMTWEQVMQEAKGLYTEFLSKDEGSYDEAGVPMKTIDGDNMQGLRFDQLSKKAKDRVLYYAVGSVKLDIKNATFEVATDTLNREAGTEGTSDSILNDKRLGETPNDVIKFFEDQTDGSVVKALNLLSELDNQNKGDLEDFARFFAGGVVKEGPALFERETAILNAVTELLAQSPVLAEGSPSPSGLPDTTPGKPRLVIKRKQNLRKGQKQRGAVGSWDRQTGELTVYVGHHQTVRQLRHTVVHEAFHALFANEISQFEKGEKSIQEVYQLNEILKTYREFFAAKENLSIDWSDKNDVQKHFSADKIPYALTSLHEFVSEVVSNADIQFWLAGEGRGRTSVLKAAGLEFSTEESRVHGGLWQQVVSSLRNLALKILDQLGLNNKGLKVDGITDTDLGTALEVIIVGAAKIKKAAPFGEDTDGVFVGGTGMRREDRETGVYFRQTNLMNPVPDISTDIDVSSTKSAQRNVAAQNLVKDTFRGLYEEYNKLGLNIEELSYEDFVKRNLGVSTAPESVIENLNAALVANGMAAVDPDYSVDDVTEKETVRSDAYRYLKKIEDRLNRKASKALLEATELREKAREDAEDFESLRIRYDEITTLTKAVEKEIRNNLRKARKDGIELTDIQRSVRDELAPKAYKDASGKRVKPVGRTGEILQAVGKRMEALGIDFSDSSVSPDDLVTAMLGDRAIASSIQSIFPDSFQKQEEAARIMVELGRSNRYLFDYAALASDSSLASERGIVNDILAEAVKPDSKAMERARAMLSRLTKSAKTAGHLLNNVQTARNKHTASNKKLQIALDRIEVRDSIGPNLSDRLSLMEETLGVEWRVEALVGDEEGGDQKRIDTLFVAVEGAEYRVPSSPEQSSSSLYKSDPAVFTSAPRTSDLIEEDLRDPEKYRAKLKADLYKIHAWLNHEGRIKDAGYNYMKRVYDQLSSQVTVGDYLDGQAGFVSKLIGTLKDEIEATGSPIMQSLVRRLTRYVADSERVRNLEALSDSWAVAEINAIEIFYPKGQMRDKESFRVNVYETALSFFENNQQILEENDSVEEAIEAAFVKLEAHLRKGHGDVSKTLQSNPQAFPALKSLLQATGDMSEAIMQQQEEMGIKVKDGTYFRKAVGAKLFTVSRSLSPKILATVINMRRDGWTKKFENIAQRYTEALADPAKMEELKAEISNKFKSDTVVANFLRPIMDIPGLTQFKSAGGAIAEDSNANMQYSLVAESNDVAEAYKMSGSETDIIAFAENLYQLTGGDPSNEESRAAYVEDVLAKLDNLFSGLNRKADEHYNPESAKGDFGTGIGRPMMDARSSSGYPSEWLQYSTYEEQSVHITIRALAANAAFGERLRGFKRDIEASELAFKEQINRLQELVSDGLSEDEIRDILNKEYGPGGYNAVKNARKNLEMVDKVNKNITSLIANDAKIYDFRTFYEVLGTFSGLVVQNIKTGLIDLSSLFAMPFTNYGFTRKGFQQFFKGFNIFKEPIGSLLQIFGRQIDMDAGMQADYTRVMVGDPDAQRDLTTRIKAAWARDVPGLDPVNPGPTRYIAKAARALQEVIGTGIRGAGSQTSQVRYATFKPLAPFTMIGQWMVATNTKNMWSTMTKLAQEGADYMRSNPDSARNPNFTFSHKNFKGMSEEAFNYMVEALNDSGMSLETLSERILLEEAAGSRPQIFTDSELRLLAIKAQEDVTKETSPLTRPSWVFTSALGRASNPLVGWSVEKFADVARKFKTKDELGNISKAAMVRSLLPYMGVLPVSLAFTFMRKEWEEEVVGKRPNILEFDYENHGLYNGVFLPALDQTNRAGTFGIAGDLVNSTLNKSTAREFNVENRVFFLSMLKGLVRTSHTLAVQGSDGLDYNNTYRPLIQTLGGSGYLETSQILTRMFGISTPETTTTKRLNVENWLRVVGRPMVNQGVVVKKPSGLVSQPNKIKPHISNMRHAAISNDSQWFMQETNAAIQAYMKLNPLDSREDAEKKIKSMYSDYHPMRRVFTRLPNEEQYEEIINSVPEEHREEIRSALDLYNSFGETIGVTPFRGKAERGSGGSGRRRSATSSREAILRGLMGGGSSSYYGGNRGNAATSRNDILRKALGY